MELATQVMALASARLGAEHAVVFDALFLLARLEIERGQASRAEEWLQRVAAYRARTVGRSHQATHDAWDELGARPG